MLTLPKLSVGILFLLSGALLGARVWWTFAEYPQPFVNDFDHSAVVVGVVSDDPDVRQNGVRVPLAVQMLNGKAHDGAMLVVLPPQTRVAYGEMLEVRGVVQEPQSFETNTGRTFDYEMYLRVRGIDALMQRAVIRSKTHAGFSVQGVLFSIKHAFEGSLERSVPQPEVSLLEGILLGERGGFSQTLLQLFVVVGLIHVVVLSGSNISIVSEGVFRVFGALPIPRSAVYILGGVTIVLFALMVGGGAATVRAVIMGSIAILARYLHRSQDALRALVVAAVAMVAWNPLVVFDNGFVLSCLATLGLITLSPSVERFLRFVPNWRHFDLRSIVATTLAVELFILPALLYTSGVLSLVSIPANALVLPLVPPIMLLGFVAGILGLIAPPLAYVPAFGASLLLKALLWLVGIAGSLPFASTIVAPFPWWLAMGAYLPLLFLSWYLYSKVREVTHPAKGGNLVSNKHVA